MAGRAGAPSLPIVPCGGLGCSLSTAVPIPRRQDLPRDGMARSLSLCPRLSPTSVTPLDLTAPQAPLAPHLPQAPQAPTWGAPGAFVATPQAPAGPPAGMPHPHHAPHPGQAHHAPQLPSGPIRSQSRDEHGFVRIPPFVRDVAKAAPRMLAGDDRVKHYAEQLVRLPMEYREAMRDFTEQFIAQMHKMGASDLDMGGAATAGRVWYRVDGDKCPRYELGASGNDEVDLLILNFLSDRQRGDLWEAGSADFSYQIEDESGEHRRFRCTAYFDNGHLGVCLRAINEEVRPLESLGFSPVIQKGVLFSNVRSGLALVTGVTGSGKSSTLDAIIDANNRDFDGHIVIIAKPIEYVHAPSRCIVRHREIGPDVPSFKVGVSQALRQDPDIIMIGEMRDPETIDAAIEAADTGHKVFSTLHTASAVESLDRIVAEYPPFEQTRVRARLADVLNCVISQKLLPRIGGGRAMAKEVLWVTPSVKAAIRNGNTTEIYQMIWEGGRQGMVTLEQDLARLVRERKVTPADGLQYANHKKRFQQLVSS